MLVDGAWVYVLVSIIVLLTTSVSVEVRVVEIMLETVDVS